MTINTWPLISGVIVSPRLAGHSKVGVQCTLHQKSLIRSVDGWGGSRQWVCITQSTTYTGRGMLASLISVHLTCRHETGFSQKHWQIDCNLVDLESCLNPRAWYIKVSTVTHSTSEQASKQVGRHQSESTWLFMQPCMHRWQIERRHLSEARQWKVGMSAATSSSPQGYIPVWRITCGITFAFDHRVSGFGVHWVRVRSTSSHQYKHERTIHAHIAVVSV